MNKDISYLQFKSFKISSNEIDNCVLLHDRSIVFISDIFQKDDVLLIRAQRFLDPKSLFTVPCASKQLGIFVISNSTTSDIIRVSILQIQRKCLKIKSIIDVDSYIVIPLQLCNN